MSLPTPRIFKISWVVKKFGIISARITNSVMDLLNFKEKNLEQGGTASPTALK
jgi:hypothetical protein